MWSVRTDAIAASCRRSWQPTRSPKLSSHSWERRSGEMPKTAKRIDAAECPIHAMEATVTWHLSLPTHEEVGANGLLDRRLFLRGGAGAALAVGGIVAPNVTAS